jgi:hypothetical protein
VPANSKPIVLGLWRVQPFCEKSRRFQRFQGQKKIVFARQAARPRQGFDLLSLIFHFRISPLRLIAVNRGKSHLIADKKMKPILQSAFHASAPTSPLTGQSVHRGHDGFLLSAFNFPLSPIEPNRTDSKSVEPNRT